MTSAEKYFFEDIFGMKSGYVIDFSNSSFSIFFRTTLKINIDDQKYLINGTSKANRMRAFLELESDALVGKALKEILDIWKYQQKNTTENVNKTYEDGIRIINRLLGRKEQISDFDNFLNKDFNFSLDKLNLPFEVQEIVMQRLSEIEICLKHGAPLSVIFLCGSILEAILLNAAAANPDKFNTSESAPKDKESKVKAFRDWTLSDLINVSYDIEFLDLDVYKFSHTLREFRNFIHPFQQSTLKFKPNIDTAKISLQVLKAAIVDLTNKRC